MAAVPGPANEKGDYIPAVLSDPELSPVNGDGPPELPMVRVYRNARRPMISPR